MRDKGNSPQHRTAGRQGSPPASDSPQNRASRQTRFSTSERTETEGDRSPPSAGRAPGGRPEPTGRDCGVAHAPEASPNTREPQAQLTHKAQAQPTNTDMWVCPWAMLQGALGSLGNRMGAGVGWGAARRHRTREGASPGPSSGSPGPGSASGRRPRARASAGPSRPRARTAASGSRAGPDSGWARAWTWVWARARCRPTVGLRPPAPGAPAAATGSVAGRACGPPLVARPGPGPARAQGARRRWWPGGRGPATRRSCFCGSASW